MESLEIRLLPVGHSDCILIRFPDASWGVVDCGSRERATSVALDYLRREQPQDTPVRFVLATHPDADHAGGVPGFLAHCNRPIHAFYHCGVERKIQRGRGPRFLALPRRAIELCDEGRLDQVKPLKAGDVISWEPPVPGLTITVLNPDPELVDTATVTPRTSNNVSVVLQMIYGKTRVLLASDIEGLGWACVVQRREFRPPHVLKVSHHGAESGMAPRGNVFKRADGQRWALLSTPSQVEDRPHLDVLRSFWRKRSWTTRCTGSSPHCCDGDQERYPPPDDDRQLPESLRQCLQFAARSQLFQEQGTRLACCRDNQIEIDSKGNIRHAVSSKTCDSRTR